MVENVMMVIVVEIIFGDDVVNMILGGIVE